MEAGENTKHLSPGPSGINIVVVSGMLAGRSSGVVDRHDAVRAEAGKGDDENQI